MSGGRSNEEWMTALQGPDREQALIELRSLLVRGLRFAMSDRADVREADLEDFAQDALLRILDALDSFRGESRFTTWAHKIAVRVALTELRRKRWQDISLQHLISQYDEGDFAPAILQDPSASPEQQVAHAMLLSMLHQFIDEALTARQREAVIAVVMGGMPLEEVARRMGTNRNALYKLLHDARCRLRDHMMSQGLTQADVMAALGS